MPTQLCNYDQKEVISIQQELDDARAQKPHNQPLIDKLEDELDAVQKKLDECRASAATVNLSSGTWSMKSNGFPLTLVIRYVDSSGNVVGWLQENTQTNILQQATWDQANGHLHFIRALQNGENQTYDGYLFDNPTGVAVDTIAGIFSADRFEGRPTFGWYA